MAPVLNRVSIEFPLRAWQPGAAAVFAGGRRRHATPKETLMCNSRLLTSSIIAITVAGSAACAQPQEAIDRIVEDLAAQGFVRIEIDIERDGTLDVDAYGGGREGDFNYDSAGNLLSFEIEEDDDYGPGYTGSDPDDDYEDDDYEDDDYEDDDDDYDYEDDDDHDDDDYGDDDDDDDDDDEDDEDD
jgi:hypothetical protein